MRIASAAFVAASLLVLPATASAASDVGLLDGGLLITAEDVPNEFVVSMTGANVYRVEDKLADLNPDGINCAHPDPANPKVVTCTKNAGEDALIYSLNAAGGDDKITVSGALESSRSYGIYGMAGNDVITGGSLYDNISGGEGDDTLTGGGGDDHMYGQDGADTLQARDGVVDSVLDCDSGGASPDDGANDLAVIDANQLEEAHNCKTVDRASGGGGGGGGGDPEPEPEPEDGVESTQVKIKVPDARPDAKSSQRFSYTSLRELQKKLEKLGVPYKLNATGTPFKKVTEKYRKTIDDGDIYAQGKKPAPGRELTIDPAKPCVKGATIPCQLELNVDYYDQSDDIKGSRCPYDHRSDNAKKLRQALKARTYDQAVAMLKERNCNFRIVNYRESKSALVEQITDANMDSVRRREGGETKRVYFVSLVVERPVRSDFSLSLTSRPYEDYEQNTGRIDEFDRELDLGKDGKLTYSTRNKGVLHVIVQENFSGRFIRNVRIELVKNPAGRPQDAKVIASSETDRVAATTFTFPVDWTGDLEVNVRVRSRRTSEDLVEDTMHGWATVPVVERPGNKAFATQSGRYFKQEANGLWRRTELWVESLKNMVDAMKQVNGRWGSADDECEAALANDANTQRAINTCWKAGIAVTRTTSGGTTTGDGLARVLSAPGYTVENGRLVDTTIPAAVVPGTTSVVGAAIISDKGAGLLENGAPVVSLTDGGSLISKNSAAILSDAMAGLVTKVEGVSLIGNKGGGILSQNGLNIIARDGAGIISDKGAGVVPAGIISDKSGG